MKLVSVIILFLALSFTNFSLAEESGMLKQLKDSLRIEKRTSTKIDLLFSLIDILEFNNQNESFGYAYQILELSKEDEDRVSELKALNILADLFYKSLQFKEALNYAMQAKNLAETLNNSKQKIAAIYTISLIYVKLGDYDTGLKHLYNCLQMSEHIGDKTAEAKALNSIGIVYHNQNNYDKALEYYSKSLSLSREIPYAVGILKALNNTAAIYGIKRDIKKAEQYIQEAISLNFSRGSSVGLGINYLNYGYCFQEINQPDSALLYYNKALDIYAKNKDSNNIIRVKIFLADYYLKIGSIKMSKQLALETLAISQNKKLKRYVYELAGLLSDIYLYEKDSIQAYKSQILELRMKDSLNIEDNQMIISNLELAYVFDKEKQEKEIIQQQKDLIYVIIFTSLFFIIILTMLLFSRARIKARTIKLEKEALELNLESRTKELTVNDMDIMKKNKILFQIIKKLKIIQDEAIKGETKIAIRKIMKEINVTIKDEQWDEFNIRFKQTHHEFYHRLLEKYPDLSPQEQRLCALLRLNMTTKEISEITGQRITTIETARTRLRKKLRINNTHANLITFLVKL